MLLVLRLRMSEATALFNLYAFMAWAGTTVALRMAKRTGGDIKLYSEAERNGKIS
jgi:hypothetical protein